MSSLFSRFLAAMLMATAFFSFLSGLEGQSKVFYIVIVRQPPDAKDPDAVRGQIAVNSEVIGASLENKKYMIPPGSYNGVMRYVSSHGHVQGPGGEMGNQGDFLIEVANVKKRTNILLHGGNKPKHSLGCILLGAVNKTKDGKKFVPDSAPLARLRKLFYGTDSPNSCPNKQILITIR